MFFNASICARSSLINFTLGSFGYKVKQKGKNKSKYLLRDLSGPAKAQARVPQRILIFREL